MDSKPDCEAGPRDIITVGPTLSRGVTLSRPMSYRDRISLMEEIPIEFREGVIGIMLTRSHVPGISNVEAAPSDILPPDRVQQILAIVSAELARMNGGSVLPTITIGLDDELTLHSEAERLVDLIRSSSFTARNGVRDFDMTREGAVREVMMSIVMAANRRRNPFG